MALHFVATRTYRPEVAYHRYCVLVGPSQPSRTRTPCSHSEWAQRRYTDGPVADSAKHGTVPFPFRSACSFAQSSAYQRPVIEKNRALSSDSNGWLLLASPAAADPVPSGRVPKLEAVHRRSRQNSSRRQAKKTHRQKGS